MLQAIDRLAPANRHVEESDHATLAIIDAPVASRRLRFVRIRRSDFPQLETRGRLSELNIPEDSGLAETIHVVIFSDLIVGADWNFHGPRPTRFAYYAKIKVPNEAGISTLRPLLRRNITEALARLNTIKLLDLKIRSSYIPQIADIDATLGDAFRGAQRFSDAQEVGLTLQPLGRRRDASLSPDLPGFIRRLLRRDDWRDGISRLHLSGRNAETGRIEAFDLLKEQLAYYEDVVKMDPKTKTLVRDSVYRAINRAYRNNRDELQSAPTIY